MEKKRNIVEWAMHYRQIVILVTCCLVAFGIYSLPQMQKNEFPDFTIRQGMVIAVAPGNTVNEMVEQVTKPLEDYIFSYKEVKKEKTFSTTRDGIVFVQVELNDELNNKDEFWSKFKHGVATFKSQLPPNVLAIQVMDDFGDTSALLITMESKDKTYRELSDYMDELKNRLRRISSVGRLTVSGERAEQISIYLDPERLSHYGLNEQLIAGQLFAKGFVTTGGRIQTPPVCIAGACGEDVQYAVRRAAADCVQRPLGQCGALAGCGSCGQGIPSCQQLYQEQRDEVYPAECGNEERKEHRTDGK